MGSVAFASPFSMLFLDAGVELASLITGGGLSGGARITDGTLFLAGPNGTVFALVADALARISTDERDLSDDEWKIADLVFRGSVPRDKIVISNGIGSVGSFFTYPRFDQKVVLSLGPKGYDDSLSQVGFLMIRPPVARPSIPANCHPRTGARLPIHQQRRRDQLRGRRDLGEEPGAVRRQARHLPSGSGAR